MNDLPVPSPGDGNNQISTNNPIIQSKTLPGRAATPSGSKEVVGGMDRPEGLADATGQETALPKEVAAAGVRVQPTSVPIPASVAQMGVKPAGNNVPVQTTPSAALPLTDDQIAAGLRMSIINSWRWLSEWCVKRLKQIHQGIRSMQGKTVRVKI